MELGWPRPNAELAEALEANDPIVYTSGGNRSTDGVALLRQLEERMATWGVTRLAEISELAPEAFPVFQTTRPNLLAHPDAGQNTGSQGKGRTALQSKISCIMEELESYCAEPKCARLIRASYRDLEKTHVVLPPKRLTHNCDTRRATAREPLMWTPAHSVEQRCEVLVPAEAVFFPFAPHTYATRSCFPCSSNGLAAGATYLEAAVHGLYEVIERCYKACYEVGEAVVHRTESDVTASEGNLTLYTVQLAVAQNLPMMIAHLRIGERVYGGYGCSANVALTVERATSEALQAYAVDISGSREDLEVKGARDGAKVDTEYPSQKLAEYRAGVVDREFATLREEFDAAVAWLHRFGFPSIAIANLTRTGIDSPVVKVVVPGLPFPEALRYPAAEPRTYTEQHFRIVEDA